MLLLTRTSSFSCFVSIHISWVLVLHLSRQPLLLMLDGCCAVFWHWWKSHQQHARPTRLEEIFVANVGELYAYQDRGKFRVILWAIEWMTVIIFWPFEIVASDHDISEYESAKVWMWKYFRSATNYMPIYGNSLFCLFHALSLFFSSSSLHMKLPLTFFSFSINKSFCVVARLVFLYFYFAFDSNRIR